MQLAEMAVVHERLAHSPVFADALWQCEAATVAAADLLAFRARMAADGLHAEAAAAAEVLAAELPRLADALQATRALFDGLATLSAVRCRAALYALATGTDPEAVAALSWRRLRPAGRGGALAADLLEQQSVTRHIRLSYVFWEFDGPRAASPLHELQQAVEAACGLDWASLRAGWHAAGGGEAALAPTGSTD